MMAGKSHYRLFPSACASGMSVRLLLLVTKYTPVNMRTIAMPFATLNESRPSEAATMQATTGCT